MELSSAPSKADAMIGTFELTWTKPALRASGINSPSVRMICADGFNVSVVAEMAVPSSLK